MLVTYDDFPLSESIVISDFPQIMLITLTLHFNLKTVQPQLRSPSTSKELFRLLGQLLVTSFRDWLDRSVQVGIRFLHRTPILVFEPNALCDGLKAAVDAEFRHIHVEGDNRIPIQVFQGPANISRQVHSLVLDICCFISSFSRISLQHIFCESNMITYWIAQYGRILQIVLTFSSPPSPKLVCILAYEILGW